MCGAVSSQAAIVSGNALSRNWKTRLRNSHNLDPSGRARRPDNRTSLTMPALAQGANESFSNRAPAGLGERRANSHPKSRANRIWWQKQQESNAGGKFPQGSEPFFQ